MATTTHDEGFHEIQLNGKQLVFLFMAGTVVAVVIFLLGVFVGRGVTARVGNEAPVAAAQEGAPPTPDIPPIAASTGSGAPATASEDLSYPNRLAGDAPKETLRREPPPASEPPAPASTPAPVQAPTATKASVPAEPGGDGFAIQLAALGKREEAETIVKRLTSKGYSAYLMAPAAGAPSVYRVRVGKFKDRREAESVSARLQKEEQFKPWIVR
jgi:cell division septation protein DedD